MATDTLQQGEVEEPITRAPQANATPPAELKEGEVEQPIERSTKNPHTIGPAPQKSVLERVSQTLNLAPSGAEKNWKPDQPMPKRTSVAENIGTAIDQFGNYTPEGRAEHPILSRVADTLKSGKEFVRLISPMSMLFAGPEGGLGLASGAGDISEIPTGGRVPVWKTAGPEAAPVVPPIEAPAKPTGPNWSGRIPGTKPAPAREPIWSGLPEAAPTPEATQAAPTAPASQNWSGRIMGPKPGAVVEPIKTPMTINDMVDRATGSQPLKMNVPLRDQIAPRIPASETPVEADPMKIKYPDAAVRRMVRANGEPIVRAVGNNNPSLMKQIHDLTRVDLRQALINSGEDMGQTTISDSKFAGEGGIGREEAFARLLKKGLAPEQIVKLAKTIPKQ